MAMIWDNPIFAKECLPRPLRRISRWQWLVIGMLAIAVFLAVAYFIPLPRSITADDRIYVLPKCWGLVTIIWVAIMSSRAILKERQQGTLDALLLSRLRPREIMSGKLAALLLPCWLIGLLILPSSLYLAISLGSQQIVIHIIQLIVLYLLIFTASAATGTIGFQDSLISKSWGSTLFGTLCMTYLGSIIFSFACTFCEIKHWPITIGWAIALLVYTFIAGAVYFYFDVEFTVWDARQRGGTNDIVMAMMKHKLDEMKAEGFNPFRSMNATDSESSKKSTE
jgi:hypothetical protein